MLAPGVALSWLRLSLREWTGRLLNLAGVPGLVGDCDYHADICDGHIQVRLGDLFTVVSVNGLDVYFHRLTGMIDGVGFSPAACCTPVRAGGSARPVAPPSSPMAIPRTGSPADRDS